MDRIIVSRKGFVFVKVQFLYVLMSLITPYIYAWYLVFGHSFSWIDFFLEGFFLFNLIFQFFVEFEVEG